MRTPVTVAGAPCSGQHLHRPLPASHCVAPLAAGSLHHHFAAQGAGRWAASACNQPPQPARHAFSGGAPFRLRADLPGRAHSSSASYSAAAGPRSSFLLSSGAFAMPHPQKVAKGGEDGWFISDNQRAIGVADGVGSWADVGINSGIYARELMDFAKVASETTGGALGAPRKALSAQGIFEYAHSLTRARGSSTSCILVLNGTMLHASNVGDSGFIVLRKGRVAMKTSQQQHGFNFPYQVGSKDSKSDKPSAAQQYEVPLQCGDVVVVGTDGLWDNCFDEEIVTVVQHCRDNGMDADQSAQVLAHYARHRAADSRSASPFTYQAYQAGFQFMGGKMDDITVVLSEVRSS